VLSGLWVQAPAVTRSLVVLPLAIHVAGFAYGRALQSALDVSLLSFKRGNVWTVFTSFLWDPPGSLLSTLFLLFFVYWVLNSVPVFERADGSGRFLLSVVLMSASINVTFLLLAQLLDLVWQAIGWFSIWPVVQCHGFMPLAVFAMSARCFGNPDEEMHFFGIRMRRKYYPFVLVSIFAVVSGPAALQDVAGLIIGRFSKQPLQLRSFLPSEATIMRWESGRCRIFGRCFFGGRWVSVSEALGGFDLDGGDGLPHTAPEARGYTMLGRPQAGRPVTSAATEFRVFAGRGQRLGSG